MNTRLNGLVLVAVSAASFVLLTHLVALPAGEQTLLLQLAVALVCVLAQMAGTSMLVLGQALFGPAPVPVRIRHFVAGDLLEI